MIILNTLKNNFTISDSKLINISIFLIFFFPISIITGPFLPDLILSIVAFLGLILFVKKKIKIKFYKEILFLWIFYIFIIISSLFSKHIIYSFDYSLFYFRFIVFSHFFIFLLINYPKLKDLLLKSILISFSVLIIFSFTELIHYLKLDEIDGIMRLHLPYSDEEVVGSFIVRMLPILCFFIFLNKENIKSYLNKFFLITIIILSFFLIIYSGERAALILLLIIIFLYFSIFIKLNKKLSFYFFLGATIFLLVNIFTNKNILNRTIQDFDRNTSLNPEVNPYLNYSIVSLKMFKDRPIIGKGPKMFRVFCPDTEFNNHITQCNIHPHSIYLQLLGEAGLIGFIFLFIAFCYTVILFVKNIYSKKPNKVYLFASVGLIVNFFPLIPSSNFFNNWINSLYYLSIIVIIYSLNTSKKPLQEI